MLSRVGPSQLRLFPHTITLREACNRKFGTLLPAATLIVGPSRELECMHLHPFSTTASLEKREITRPRLSKAKALALKEKMEKKSKMRERMQRREQRREQLRSEEEAFKREQDSGKLEEAKNLVAHLKPFTESELESIYTGLMLAKPEELALNSISSPENLALLSGPQPVGTSDERVKRLEEFAERIGMKLQNAPGSESQSSEIGGLTGALGKRISDRLLQKQSQSVGIAENQPTGPEEVIGSTEAGPVVESLDLKGDGATSDSANAQQETTKEDVPLRAQILDHLESTALSTLTSESVGPGELTLGLAARTDWADLIMEFVNHQEMDQLSKTITLMQKLAPLKNAELPTKVMSMLAAEKRAKDAMAFSSLAIEQHLPFSVSTHHYLLSALLPDNPELALRHVHAMEKAGYTPKLATYAMLIEFLVRPGAPSHFIRQGWDLFAHSRLVSHPIPDVPLYSVMIEACSNGSKVSAYRAVDFFVEMTEVNQLPPSESAYTGLIRACARDGSLSMYYEALRYMRQMLDSNVMPSVATFHALLEGCKIQGDLARARWILIKMISLGGSCSPDAKALGLVFSTYARYSFPSNHNHLKPRNPAPADLPFSSSSNDSAPDANTTVEPKAFFRDVVSVQGKKKNINPVPSSSPSEDTQVQIADILGTTILEYPGRLPQTHQDLLIEAQVLMGQCIGKEKLLATIQTTFTGSSSTQAKSPSDETAQQDDEPFQSAVFPSLQPSRYLLDSYLSLLCRHSTVKLSMAYFSNAYISLGITKSRLSFEMIMHKCDRTRSQNLGNEQPLETARQVFDEWRSSFLREKMEAIRLSETESKQEGTLSRPPSASRALGRNIRHMYVSLIKTFAKHNHLDEALATFEEFFSTYSHSALIAYAQKQREDEEILAREAKAGPITLSHPAYPETSRSQNLYEPPHILFSDVQLLHLKFSQLAEKEKIERILHVTQLYQDAANEAQTIMNSSMS